MKITTKSLITYACLIGTALACYADATTYYVDGAAGNDQWDGRCEAWQGGSCGPKRTILGGLQAATSDENIVMVADGVYAGAGNTNITFPARRIRLSSRNGSENCVIDCNGESRAFYFNPQTDRHSAIIGFTVRNGSANRGGAIFSFGGEPAFLQCRFFDNRAVGDFYDGDGGAICALNGTVRIVECQFMRNSAADSGGAVRVDDSNSDILNCTFANNEAGVTGGAVFAGAYSKIRVCAFRENFAPIGAAAYLIDAIVNQSVFVQNHASDIGGAVRALYSEIKNSLFIGNTADVAGGAIWGSDLVVSSTVIDNSAGTGGGIYLTGDLEGSIIWHNHATQGQQVAVNGGADILYSTIEGGLDLVYSDAETSLTWVDSDGKDPRFVSMANEDYHLLVDSPCIDAGGGQNSDGMQDLDGNNRIVKNGVTPAISGGYRDRGAYENQQTCPGDFTGNHDIDLEDIAAVIRLFGQRGFDVDGDGLTTLVELSFMLNAYGTSCD